MPLIWPGWGVAAIVLAIHVLNASRIAMQALECSMARGMLLHLQAMALSFFSLCLTVLAMLDHSTLT